MEADIPSVTLALQTLGSFNFGGWYNIYCTKTPLFSIDCVCFHIEKEHNMQSVVGSNPTQGSSSSFL